MNSEYLGRVIAAVKTTENFNEAIHSEVSTIFDLNPDLHNVAQRIKSAHNVKKKYFAHLDLAGGIGKDKSGILFIKQIGADGIISTRSNIIKLARELDIPAIQRFFTVDSKSVETAIESAISLKPDMIELMPGICDKVITKIKMHTKIPVIAGGLIETAEEVDAAICAGACAVSTGNTGLWK